MPPRLNSEQKKPFLFYKKRNFSSVPNLAFWCLTNQSMPWKGKWQKASFSPTVIFILSHQTSLTQHTLNISVKLTAEN